MNTPAVPYQTFDMTALVQRPPQSVIDQAAGARNEAARASAGALVSQRRLLARLPAAARVVFVGEAAGSLLPPYQQRHTDAACQHLAWDHEALPAALAQADLVVVGDAQAASSPDTLPWLGLADHTSAQAQLCVCPPASSRSLDALYIALMDAGWVPHRIDTGETLAAGWLLVQCDKRFAAAPANSGPALFDVVVASPGQAQQPGAAGSAGLAEVAATVTVVSQAGSAAEALAAAGPRLQADWVLLCREDAYFPAGFGHRLNTLLAGIAPEARAGQLLGFIGIGVDARQQGFAPAGFVVEQYQREHHAESQAAVSIDELALVVARESLHQIDPALGWHLWATDLCLSAICHHKRFPQIVAMPLLHLSPQAPAASAAPAAGLAAEFVRSAHQLAAKFPQFGPIPTLNGSIDAAFLARHPLDAPADAVPATPTPVQPASSGSPAVVAAPLAANAVAGIGCCSVCGETVSAWTPHPQRALRSEFMKLLDVVGSDLSVYQCPACGCNDRDRHLWHYMAAVGLLQRLPSARILHIAPERHLEVLIQGLRPAAYLRGDLHPRRPEHLKLDVENLPFEDGHFDLVICNHVLEHVASPARALGEFHRCLSDGGLLIAQTPYAPSLKHTLELNTPVSPAFAKLFYGQEDHVRLFGADITALFHAAGFSGELLGHTAVLGEMDAKAQGCNGREPFFAFSK